MNSTKCSKDIKASALDHGFSAAKIIPFELPKLAYRQFYTKWLSKQKLGRQKYLDNIRTRFHGRRIFKSVNSLVVLTAPYFSEPNNKFLQTNARNKIARYAHGRDYHRVLKKKCNQIILEFALTGRSIVDSAPFPERFYANLAGIGEPGKNGLLINREQGSYLFLAYILVADYFDTYDAPNKKDFQAQLTDVCGSCDRCIKACPTKALKGDGTLELSQCLSTITIEEPAGTVPALASEKKHRWVFGCDICQQVCPYNKESKETTMDDFNLSEAAKAVMEGIVNLDDSQVDLNGTPLKRAGIKKINENLARIRSF